MKNLKSLILANKISIKATVYINATTNLGDGFQYFVADMQKLGVKPSELVEGVHFYVNRAENKTGQQKPYTGEVRAEGPISAEFVEEIADMIAERNSDLTFSVSGNMHVYNNPLFREAVALGAWSSTAAFKTEQADDSADFSWVRDIVNGAKNRQRLAKIAAAEEALKGIGNVAMPAKFKTTMIRGVECCPCGVNVKYCSKHNPQKQAEQAEAARLASNEASRHRATISRQLAALAATGVAITDAEAPAAV